MRQSKLQVHVAGPGSPQLQRVLQRDLPAIGQLLHPWGRFAGPVELKLAENLEQMRQSLPMHSLLDLRGVALTGGVWILRPEAWPEPPSDQELARLLAHELAHVLWLQRTLAPHRPHAYVPTWFREGFAVVASEGPPAAQGRRKLAGMPLQKAAYADDAAIAELGSECYLAAAHLFALWHDQFGRRGLSAIQRSLRGGATFAVAFQAACGVSDHAFVAGKTFEIADESRLR